MPESHSSQEKSDNALRDECQGCHSGHVEPDCPAHGVDSEQARINYMSPEERDAEYRRKFGSDECEACGGRHDNCGKPDYCCAGCDKIPRSTVATEADILKLLRDEITFRQHRGEVVLLSILGEAADEIERVRSENNLHRAIRDHSVYCQCEQCQQIRDILGEPYRR